MQHLKFVLVGKEQKLKQMKDKIFQMKKAEMNRVESQFKFKDYKLKFNVDIQVVKNALAGKQGISEGL